MPTKRAAPRAAQPAAISSSAPIAMWTRLCQPFTARIPNTSSALIESPVAKLAS